MEITLQSLITFTADLNNINACNCHLFVCLFVVLAPQTTKREQIRKRKDTEDNIIRSGKWHSTGRIATTTTMLMRIYNIIHNNHTQTHTITTKRVCMANWHGLAFSLAFAFASASLLASPNYRIGKHWGSHVALMACKHMCNQCPHGHTHSSGPTYRLESSWPWGGARARALEFLDLLE